MVDCSELRERSPLQVHLENARLGELQGVWISGLDTTSASAKTLEINASQASWKSMGLRTHMPAPHDSSSSVNESTEFRGDSKHHGG